MRHPVKILANGKNHKSIDGYVLSWNPSTNTWVPGSIRIKYNFSDGYMGGDLSGTYPTPTVLRIQGSTSGTAITCGGIVTERGRSII